MPPAPVPHGTGVGDANLKFARPKGGILILAEYPRPQQDRMSIALPGSAPGTSPAVKDLTRDPSPNGEGFRVPWGSWTRGWMEWFVPRRLRLGISRWRLEAASVDTRFDLDSTLALGEELIRTASPLCLSAPSARRSTSPKYRQEGERSCECCVRRDLGEEKCGGMDSRARTKCTSTLLPGEAERRAGVRRTPTHLPQTGEAAPPGLRPPPPNP